MTLSQNGETELFSSSTPIFQSKARKGQNQVASQCRYLVRWTKMETEKYTTPTATVGYAPVWDCMHVRTRTDCLWPEL